MTEEHKHLFRQQQEGYEIFRRLRTKALREMTFEDRLAAFNRVTALAPSLRRSESRADDDQVTQTWMRIRERFDAGR